MTFLDLDFVLKRIVLQEHYKNKVQAIERKIKEVEERLKQDLSFSTYADFANTLKILIAEQNHYYTLEKLDSWIEGMLIREKKQDEMISLLTYKLSTLERWLNKEEL